MEEASREAARVERAPDGPADPVAPDKVAGGARFNKWA